MQLSEMFMSENLKKRKQEDQEENARKNLKVDDLSTPYDKLIKGIKNYVKKSVKPSSIIIHYILIFYDFLAVYYCHAT
ncbi:hypothetical protein Glove_291g27 [Diversispora epigaea]|uniref:Uncharacterized protein n=1 Tax=Diversispora epigaea TaxID=1348612 RepID=A0A397I5F5_9GLOM|nr:hypothetical protein Glove_291g27 [Diversispora epigaea]